MPRPCTLVPLPFSKGKARAVAGAGPPKPPRRATYFFSA